MKIDRLIGILSILLQKKRVTAPYLAEKFEVSRRTINRDIESLCKAGIPLVTIQGAGGGIEIMGGYRIEHTLLTSQDMQAILAGLRSLDSVAGSKRYQQLMEKLTMGGSSVLPSNQRIAIDLSSWHRNSLAPKIELIQSAIENKEMISFEYYAPAGESFRTIEPYLLVFRWSSWYVWGYCLKRRGFRMFKLNRQQGLKNQGEIFKPRQVPEFKMAEEVIFPAAIFVKVLFDPCMQWRLIEEYGIESFCRQEDGKLLFKGGFTDKGSLFGWLLSFGDQAELVEPECLREDLREMIWTMGRKYKG